MDKKKLTGIIAAVVVIIIVVVIVTRLSPALPGVEPALATLTCTEVAADSLTARGEVTDIGAGPLSLRGFVYMEGTTGNPEIAIIALENPSVEVGDPPEGWLHRGDARGSYERSGEQAKVGAYSCKATNVINEWYYVFQDLPEPAGYAGVTITLGAWIWASAPDRVRLGILDRVEGTWGTWAYSSYHPGDARWHFLTAAMTVRSGIDAVRIAPVIIDAGSSISAYADGPVLLQGRAVFEHGSFGTGAYSLSITDLKPDTTYRIRAFGQNESGIWYGDAVNCKTLQEP